MHFTNYNYHSDRFMHCMSLPCIVIQSPQSDILYYTPMTSCMHACMCVRMCLAFLSLRACVHVFTRVCICMCVCVCVCVCVKKIALVNTCRSINCRVQSVTKPQFRDKQKKCTKQHFQEWNKVPNTDRTLRTNHFTERPEPWI